MKIRTSFDNPPIPDRSFDWSAVTEDYDLGHPIGHGSTEAEAIADLQSQIDSSDDEPFATNRYSEAPSPLVGLLPLMQEPPRSPCLSCHTHAILSDIGLCCSCQHELTIFKALRESRPVYVLTENLGFYKVLAVEKAHNEYLIKTAEFSFNLRGYLENFHLSVPSLVTTGITKANDAILRFNQLHKQHIATNP